MKPTIKTEGPGILKVLNNKWVLYAELILIFIIIPLVFGLRVIHYSRVLVPLLLLCIPAAIWLGKTSGFNRETFWSADPTEERKYLRVLVPRFFILGILLITVAMFSIPDQLFSLPFSHPEIWLILLGMYIAFSVYPQELLFRAFFFRRYKSLFASREKLLIVNAILFGWLHVAFGSFTSMWLSLVAGGIYALTYQKTRSLRLVCFEHALYGSLTLSVGYAGYFVYNKELLGGILH